MDKKIPIYNINIDDEDCFMSAISLVDAPAVEVDFLAFKAQEKLVFSEDRHVITGVVCLADTPIYRRDKRGEFYIRFTKEVIEKMMLRYSQMGLWNSVNLEHNDNAYTDKVIMIEMYVKNSDRGIVPVEFADVPEGSLFASYKVLDDELWNEIKNGRHFNGFSLEIFANLDKVEMSEQQVRTTEEDLDEEVAKMLR